MSIVITDASPQATQAGTEEVSKGFKQKYPFDQLTPGKCFTVPVGEANVKSLRARCSQLSIDGKRFVVVVHGEPHNCVEVARTA